MKILMVNKFLYPNGGSETYMLRLGEQLTAMGHSVSYFGMADERNTVGNEAGQYTDNVNFREGGKLSKITYPFKIIYSSDARKKIRRVLETFKPDVVHMNNINFQITPSIIYEIKKAGVPIVWTAHDYQTICPNHMLYIPQKGEICEKCTMHSPLACVKNKCIHESMAQSLIGAAECSFYRMVRAYAMVDKIICPSRFIEEKLKSNKKFAGKTAVLHNFIEPVENVSAEKENYVLYFGRFDTEKGLPTLLKVCEKMPDTQFVFAGSGSLADRVGGLPNVKNVGFITGDALKDLIRRARVSVYPSEWYENCPFSVMESQQYGTPVVGSRIGGIPELVNDGSTGFLFEPTNANDLQEKLELILDNDKLAAEMSENCMHIHFDSLPEYCEKLIGIYNNVL